MEETPMTRSYAIGAGITTTVWLIITYCIAFVIWGFALGNIILFFIIGAIIGLLTGTLSGLAVASQRSEERAKEMGFAASSTWGGIVVVIGILGLVASIIRILFFHGL